MCLCGWSWAVLVASVRGLGPLLGPMLAVLGRSWAYVDGLGALLGPMLAVLGRSWDLCWRSWAALGAYVDGLGPLLGPVGGLGRLSGPMLAVLGCLGASVGGLKKESNRKVVQNPNGKAIWKGVGPP